MAAETCQVLLALPVKQRDELDVIAQRVGISRSALIRLFIHNGLAADRAGNGTVVVDGSGQAAVAV